MDWTEAHMQGDEEARQNASIHATIVHSCSGLDRDSRNHIARKYGCAAMIEQWMPGDELCPNAIHFIEFSPATDRNGIEDWKGKQVRFVSMTVALVQARV